jgi:hypothetical protein
LLSYSQDTVSPFQAESLYLQQRVRLKHGFPLEVTSEKRVFKARIAEQRLGDIERPTVLVIA